MRGRRGNITQATTLYVFHGMRVSERSHASCPSTYTDLLWRMKTHSRNCPYIYLSQMVTCPFSLNRQAETHTSHISHHHHHHVSPGVFLFSRLSTSPSVLPAPPPPLPTSYIPPCKTWSYSSSFSSSYFCSSCSSFSLPFSLSPGLLPLFPNSSSTPILHSAVPACYFLFCTFSSSLTMWFTFELILRILILNPH